MNGLDDECLAFPATTRAPHELTNGRREMRTPVQRDDAHVMDVLLQNDHEVGVLQKVVVVVVSGRKRRDAAIPETPLAQTQFFWPIGGSQSILHIGKTAVLGRPDPVERLYGQLRQPAV